MNIRRSVQFEIGVEALAGSFRTAVPAEAATPEQLNLKKQSKKNKPDPRLVCCACP